MAKQWRNTKANRDWRANAIATQKCCKVCGSTNKLEVHHLNDGSNFPELRFEPSNAIVLCDKHHDFLHFKYKKNSRQKTTEEDFNDFLAIINEGKRIAKEELNKETTYE